MFGIGALELLIVLIIVLIIFGAGKLPNIGAGLGSGIRNFRKAVAEPREGSEKKSPKRSFSKGGRGLRCRFHLDELFIRVNSTIPISFN